MALADWSFIITKLANRTRGLVITSLLQIEQTSV